MSCRRGVLYWDVKWLGLAAWLLIVGVFLAGCAGHGGGPSSASTAPAGKRTAAGGVELARLGYAVQVGAFARVDNAVRLMTDLQRQGLDAYYFKHSDGLFKVRFGDFSSGVAARERAVALRKTGVIDSFYIVRPLKDVPGSRQGGNGALRKNIVQTARRFLGVPYKWGGESSREGFDCSGLAMAVYRLNGLNLPRNSRQQYRAGRSVRKGELRPGDLVFFATKGGHRVNHVGIYLGENRFIHAPGTGKNIRVASLGNPYFKKRYQGGRTYMAGESS